MKYEGLRDRSLILPGERVEDIWEGDQNSAHSEGGGQKIKRFQEKDYGVSSEVLEWGSTYLHKSEKGTKIPPNI